MNYKAYESPYVRESRKHALERARLARKRKTNCINCVQSERNYRQSEAKSIGKVVCRQPWNSDFAHKSLKNGGLFDPTIKRVEIFKVHRRKIEGITRNDRPELGTVGNTVERICPSHNKVQEVLLRKLNHLNITCE